MFLHWLVLIITFFVASRRLLLWRSIIQQQSFTIKYEYPLPVRPRHGGLLERGRVSKPVPTRSKLRTVLYCSIEKCTYWFLANAWPPPAASLLPYVRMHHTHIASLASPSPFPRKKQHANYGRLSIKLSTYITNKLLCSQYSGNTPTSRWMCCGCLISRGAVVSNSQKLMCTGI